MAAYKTKEALINELSENCQRCTSCPLHETRTNVVFARGSVDAPLFFLGEAPGEGEDIAGVPFVGRAGKVLDGWLAALGLTEGDWYIANTVKCRPPENRRPSDVEQAACRRWIEGQIDIVQPVAIIALGAVAAKWALGESMDKISKMRGKWQDFHGIPLMPTFHPSYIMRTGDQHKADVMQDLEEVKRRMVSMHREVEVPHSKDAEQVNIIDVYEQRKGERPAERMTPEKYQRLFKRQETDLSQEETTQMSLDIFKKIGGER